MMLHSNAFNCIWFVQMDNWLQVRRNRIRDRLQTALVHRHWVSTGGHSLSTQSPVPKHHFLQLSRLLLNRWQEKRYRVVCRWAVSCKCCSPDLKTVKDRKTDGIKRVFSGAWNVSCHTYVLLLIWDCVDGKEEGGKAKADPKWERDRRIDRLMDRWIDRYIGQTVGMSSDRVRSSSYLGGGNV